MELVTNVADKQTCVREPNVKYLHKSQNWFKQRQTLQLTNCTQCTVRCCIWSTMSSSGCRDLKVVHTRS